MVLEDASLCIAVGDGANPRWQLAVPDESVATDLFVVGGSEIDEDVGWGEIKVVS